MALTADAGATTEVLGIITPFCDCSPNVFSTIGYRYADFLQKRVPTGKQSMGMEMVRCLVENLNVIAKMITRVV